MMEGVSRVHDTRPSGGFSRRHYIDWLRVLAVLLFGDFLVWNIRDGGDYFGGFGLGHLWFIFVLLLLSIVVLPLLVWGRTGRGGRTLSADARRLARLAWWLLLLFFIMVGDALPELSLRPFDYIGCGKRYLDRPSPALAYLARGFYPIYILHQTVIVVAAVYLVDMPGSGLVGWLALLATSVAGSFALYEVVRRVAPLRILFGMRRDSGRSDLGSARPLGLLRLGR